MICSPFLEFTHLDGELNMMHAVLSNILDLIIWSNVVVLGGRNDVLVAGEKLANTKTDNRVMIGGS
jgi:hypothetical protein